MRFLLASISLCLALQFAPQRVSAEQTQPIGVAPGTQQKSMRFSRLRSELRDGDSIGNIRTGSDCSGPMGLTMNARTEQAVMGQVPRIVREEFMKAGYRDPLRTQQKLFEDESDAGQSDLLLGAMLLEFQTNYCSSASGSRTEGRVRVKVRWETYDTQSRVVVHTKTTEGQYQTSGLEAMREGEFFSMAYRDAVKGLLADPQFHATVIASSVVETTGEDITEALPKIALRPATPLGDALTSNVTLTRAAVVTISHSAGSGSGFFVSENGYMLTNSHVVGTNRFVRVILATGRELVGEVMRRDLPRDVALIKTEGANYVALPMHSGDVNVGSDVTAIGSPLGEALSGTVTRGIVSAYRTLKGKRYIQSDVQVLPGSSGGPLLDKEGRVVGITAAGLNGARINFFIPIQEALGSLGITMTAK